MVGTGYSGNRRERKELTVHRPLPKWQGRNTDKPGALLYLGSLYVQDRGLAVGQHDCSGRNLATVPEPPTRRTTE